MCGIAGVIYADSNRPVDLALLRAMGESLAHRGPDAEGFWTEPGLGLVHRRLSIIDLSGGDQPIANEDGCVQVVFNGEIYNFQSLRARLEAKGHIFRTQSDTEVLAHLYEEEGASFVSQLRGMFAFAIWDRKQKQLVLGRDRLGIKPLYVYRDSEKVIFGSEVKAILAHPEVDRRIDPRALDDYLAFGMVPGSRAIFQGVEKLAPAHVLELQPNALNRPPRQYWELRFEPDETMPVGEWKDAIRAKLEEVVRLHLIADVPVGALLSGGIDSSLLVSECRKHISGALRTFSIGFEERSFDELPYARQVAEQFGTQHLDQIVTPDAVSLLEQLTFHYDEPFADASAIPTFLVAQLASQSVKVVISGDGGDEAFGGYARYAHDLDEARLRGGIPSWVRKAAIAPLGRIWPKADWLPRPLRAKTRLTNLALEPDAAYANTLMMCRSPLRCQLLAGDIVRSINGHDPAALIRRAYAGAPHADPLGGMLAADTAVILPDDFLVKVDRASMAHGLEVRPPMLDHELMELTARLPSRMKVSRGQTKWLLRECYRDVLPKSILDRPKQGFEVPLDSWFRGPLRPMFEDTVLASGSPIADLIDQRTVASLYQSHVKGLARQGAILWSLLFLARWAERYLSHSAVARAAV